MKVLNLIQRYWPYEGGSEGVFKENSERLVADGHSVTVCTSDAWDIEYLWSGKGKRVEKPREEHNGVDIRRYPAKHLPKQETLGKYLSMLPSEKIRTQTSHPFIRIPSLLKDIRSDESFDIVTAGVLPYDLFMRKGLEFAKKRGIPFVAWPMLHLGIHKTDSLNNAFLTKERMQMVKQADHIMVNTASEIPALVENGIDEERITVGGLGVDPRQVWGGRGLDFRNKHRIHKPIILQLSKQIIDKGSQHTVEAVKMLWNNGYDCALVLAGQVTDNFDSYWFEQPGEVHEKTYLLDYVTAEEKKDLLDAADIFVMPSKADSFGIVYFESWLYKKPVVGAFAGGVPSVIDDGKDGFLVPYGDPHFLAETLATLLDTPDLARSMGEEGYKNTLRDYTWDAQYQNLLSAYEKALA